MRSFVAVLQRRVARSALLCTDPGERSGRGARIRTGGLLRPRQARYQAALRPDIQQQLILTHYANHLPPNQHDCDPARLRSGSTASRGRVSSTEGTAAIRNKIVQPILSQCAASTKQSSAQLIARIHEARNRSAHQWSICPCKSIVSHRSRQHDSSRKKESYCLESSSPHPPPLQQLRGLFHALS